MGVDISFAIKCSKVVYLSAEVLKKKKIPIDFKEYAKNLLFTVLSLLVEDTVFSKVGEKEFKKLCGDIEIYKGLRLSFEKNYTNYIKDLEKLRGAIFNIDDILNNFTQKM